MARLLIVYGTTDGHTRRIAEALTKALRADGHEASAFDAARIPADVGPACYHGVIVAGSLQMRRYPRALRRWVRANARALEGRRTAFVSVCLAVLAHRPETDRDLQRMIGEFFRATRWSARVTRIVAGGLPYSRYGWLKTRFMRAIAARTGLGTDTTRDYDYTDWADIRAFAQDFGRRCAAPDAAAEAAEAAAPVPARSL